MSNLTPAEAADRRKAAKIEHRALIEWEQNGMQGDRPEAPNYDAIVADSTSGKKAKSAKPKGERTPRVNPIDEEVRTVMTDGTHSHPVTVGEIAKSIDRPSSSTQHALWRMLETGELVRTEGRPARHWHRDMGDMPEVPTAEPTSSTRERKVYKAETKSGTVHDCHRVKGDDGFKLVPVCITGESKVPNVTKVEADAETTCKRCLKATAA